MKLKTGPVYSEEYNRGVTAVVHTIIPALGRFWQAQATSQDPTSKAKDWGRGVFSC